MKILKQENIDNWEYKHTCVNCSSELLVERGDLVYNTGFYDHREGQFYGDDFTCKCPVCNSYFAVPKSVIPKLLQIQIKKDQENYLENHSR